MTAEDIKSIGELIFAFEDRLDAKMDAKFAAFEERMDAKIDAKIDAKFAAFEKRMDAKIDAKIDAKLAPINEKLDMLFESMEEIRTAVNVLAAWADKASRKIQVAL